MAGKLWFIPGTMRGHTGLRHACALELDNMRLSRTRQHRFSVKDYSDKIRARVSGNTWLVACHALQERSFVESVGTHRNGSSHSCAKPTIEASDSLGPMQR